MKKMEPPRSKKRKLRLNEGDVGTLVDGRWKYNPCEHAYTDKEKIRHFRYDRRHGPQEKVACKTSKNARSAALEAEVARFEGTTSLTANQWIAQNWKDKTRAEMIFILVLFFNFMYEKLY